MKNQVAASAVAIASLAREGFTPPGDLVFIAAADEEVGENFGLQWLCEEHPDTVRVDYADQRGRRRAARDRGDAALPLRERREDVRALPAARARPQRPCLDARDRGQRAREGGAADREAAAYEPEPAIGPEVAGFLDAVLGEQLPRRRGAATPAGARSARGRDDRAAARVHALADDGRGLGTAERDPRDGGAGRRPPPAPGPDARGRRPGHPRGARAGRLRARDDRAVGRARARRSRRRSGTRSRSG